MIRLLSLLLFVLMLAPPPAVGAPVPPPAAPAITAEQAGAVLDMLNDPAKRAAFAATLQTIVKAQAAPLSAVSQATPDHPSVSLEPDGLGAQALLAITQFMQRTRDQLSEATQAIQSVPLLWGWLYVMATNPLGQAVSIAVGWRLLVALAAGLGVAWALNRALRRPSARLIKAARALSPAPVAPEDRAEVGDVEAPVDDRWPKLRTLLQRVWLAVGRFGLALVPLLGLLAAGHAVAGAVGVGDPTSGLVIAAVLGAYALSAALIAAASIVLEPESGDLRLVRLPDKTARDLLHWWRRLVSVAVCGYALAAVGSLLAMSIVAQDAILRMTSLLVTCGVGVMILRQRRAVRQALRAPDGATGPTALLRNFVAIAWHWIALLGLAAIWLGWAIDIGISGMWAARMVALTVLVLIGSKLVSMSLLSVIERLPGIGEQASDRFPGLPDRLRLYHPALTAAVRTVVHVLAVMTLLQVYGTGALTWLWTTAGGQRVMSGVITLAVTVLVSVAVWEMVNAAIQRHLNRLLKDAQLSRSARLRTLLPILRTALLIAIMIVGVLMVLSELGVNIAPLLAGAGILGVAIGFGAQKLVQDLITGIFLLLENALQVGDQVNVAGLAGKVEGLSVRTIRLRAVDGAVHIVPFSSVATVTNHSRGVGNADVSVTVDFNADTDKVAEVLTAIVAEMRQEPAYAALITADFRLFGVDKIDAQGVTITGQVACSDSGRWSVQREINRRIKLRFNEAGIRFFNQPLPVSA